METPLAFISMPGGMEWLIIGMIGLLLFGKRLPEVGSSLGRSIVEFKKGLRGIENDIEEASRQAANPPSQPMLNEPASEASTTPEFNAECDTPEKQTENATTPD